ncbi:alpha,alpha-trehalose-phosphate synthase (UDP-forming) [Brucella anthropi]|uniref:alpha,alpha-trehalose-phosphate synthase (UDP-forming) n=1 Tax=Brucella anthropi TaxID=529 RepID=UPI00244C8201|nr:alpha,alpha-trehalose-phosphate synthase (UDP-forming) [Brucella anthropi]MDH0367143.1 alpha,alpha-trehalose-phosphate synthase (UDP-forming) [Brucella anthropi]
MGRLIVVSNRVPLPDEQGKAPAGGLAVALQAALSERGGIWLGWSGKTLPNRQTQELAIRDVGSIRYALLDLHKKDIDEYYAGFANRMLWPLCHYRLDLIDYTRKDMAGYFRVNRLFAKHLLPMIEPDDVIWVHDYHLIPLAAELRNLGVTNRIGFFLHIPWPPADILFTLPVHETIMRGLASYDVVGFQTENDVDNFIGCLRREKIGKRLDDDGLFEAFGHQFRAERFGIGIETAAFAEIAKKAQRHPTVKRMSDSMLDRDLIIGVDRLDYSKGITNRMEAFEHFLKVDPGNRGKVTFLQVTPKSRSEIQEYKDMQRAVAELAGRVNGANATVDWTPIRYINRSLNREVLAGLYRLAAVGLVTPLRDGMNLVAKEYVAAQDPENPGVLVLSRFAGAAQELDGALLVNPYDTEAMAYAMARALAMPLAERKERFESMMAFLITHDVNHWCDDFLDRLSPG